jgi:hypothetical protein
MKSHCVTRLAALVVALITTGCMSEGPERGALVIPVETRGSDGALYHLIGQLDIITYTVGRILVDSVAGSKLFVVYVEQNLWVASFTGEVESSTDDGATWHVVEATEPPRGFELPAGRFAYVNPDHSYTIQFTFLVQKPDGELTLTFAPL